MKNNRKKPLFNFATFFGPLLLLAFAYFFIPFGKIFLGTIAFIILPGFYITMMLSLFLKINILEKITLSFGLSITTSVIIYIFLHQKNPIIFSLDQNIFILYFFSFCSVLAVITTFLFLWKKQYIHLKLSKDLLKETFLALVSFLPSITLIVLFNYRHGWHIAQPDTAFFYSLINRISNTGTYPAYIPDTFPAATQPYAPLFQYTTVFWHFFSGIDNKILINYLWPVLFTLIILPINLIVREVTEKKVPFFLVAALLLVTPSIIIEFIIVRPQIYLFIIMTFVLWLLAKYINTKKGALIWLILAVFFSFVSVEIHKLGFICLPIVMFCFLLKNINFILKNKIKALGYLIIGAVVIYPYLLLLGLTSSLFKLIHEVVLSHGHMHLLSGAVPINTYGAYLAIIIPILSLCFIFYAFKKNILFYRAAPIILFTVLFFISLEIFPRLGFHFMPTRSFFFLGLGLLITSCAYIVLNKKIWQNKFLTLSIVVLYVISIAMSGYVFLLPENYTINEEEVNAVKYLKMYSKESTPVILTQFANKPIVDEIGGIYCFSDSTVMDGLMRSNTAEDSYKKFSIYFNYEEMINNKIAFNRKKAADLISGGSVNGKVNSTLSEIKNLNNSLQYYSQIKNPNYYILYSSYKNQSFYSRHDWWTQKNYLNINLNKFDDSRFFTKIYDEKGMKIWQIKHAEP